MNWKYQMLKIIKREYESGLVAGLFIGTGFATLCLARRR